MGSNGFASGSHSTTHSSSVHSLTSPTQGVGVKLEYTKSPRFTDQLQLAGVLSPGFPVVPEHLYNIHDAPSENNNSRLTAHKVPNQITFFH